MVQRFMVREEERRVKSDPFRVDVETVESGVNEHDVNDTSVLEILKMV